MKITQLELILTHSPRKNAPPQDELFSIFTLRVYKNEVLSYISLKGIFLFHAAHNEYNS